MIRVLVVSPTPAVRLGLAGLLGAARWGAEPLLGASEEPAAGITVVGQAPGLGRLIEGDGSGLAGVDVVVLDPAPGDLEALPALAGSGGVAPVVLGPVPGDARLAEALSGRAWGYLGRDVGAETLAAAVRAVAEGLTVVEPPLAATWRSPGGRALDGDTLEPGGEELTAREREVLQLVAQGLPNKSIAQRLGISEHTVKFHVAAILGKLGAASRAEAVRLGARRGLIAL